jgi:hypothetical protein
VSATVRIREFWASVRPRTRRGAVLAVAAILGMGAVFSIAFVVVAQMAATPYLETVFHPDANARTWAALDARYAGRAECTSCHAPQATKAAAAQHATISCESCHGALLEHSVASAANAKPVARIETPTDEVCVKCHAKAVGRPLALGQVVPADHYVAACLDCHDPHTAVARRPPEVLHPLDQLPPCLVCHGDDGFKARNQRHPKVTGDDATCLACHEPGRGQAAPR